ncbi:hypothetical protein [Laribacter hongkongensis]|uniref:hypothetical protein n=1 Tax=Laribacter hongkongensis TaxID=168471 RepID=UPI00042602E5|nr:hypothetical protein [Laribacter hongkongensis]
MNKSTLEHRRHAFAAKAAQDMALRRGVPLSPPNPETRRNAQARRFAEDLDKLIAAIYPTTH